MIELVYETHSTTVDNESHLCSGFFDVELSDLGIHQAKQLGNRRAADKFEAIFCSDLQRSYKTAELAFGTQFPIMTDARLRECDYGDLTRHSSDEVEPEKLRRIIEPFPNGESYQQTTARIGVFLEDLLLQHDGQRVLIIGHGATWSGLEYWLHGKTIETSVAEARGWQPGWNYQLTATDLKK